MASSPWYIGSDKSIVITGLSGTNIAGTTAYLNSATITWFLYDPDGDEVTNGTMTYVAASNGNYRGVVESTVTSTLTKGAIYKLKVVIVQGGFNDERWIEEVAMRRGSC